MIACITETWGKEDRLGYRKNILSLIHREGLGIISWNRKIRRGGGVAIVFNTEVVIIDELDVIVPHNLEIVWGLVRPRKGTIKEIIMAAFYYPPKTKKKQQFINHVVETLHLLLSKHLDAEIIIAGDRNELDLSPIFVL